MKPFHVKKSVRALHHVLTTPRKLRDAGFRWQMISVRFRSPHDSSLAAWCES
jgi:hypothetical protein